MSGNSNKCSVFTSGRVFDGRLPFAPLHWERLKKGVQWMEGDASPEFWGRLASEALGWIKAQAPGAWAFRAEIHQDLEYAFTRRELGPLEQYPAPVALTGASGERFQDLLPPGVKCPRYEQAMALKDEARGRGFDDVYFSAADGRLMEASTSNIFMLIEDEIWTPKEGAGVLKGIARQALQKRMNVKEKDIPSDWPQRAREVWLTNSVRGIVPVKRVDDIEYPCRFVENVKKYYEQALLLEMEGDLA